jgi:glycosyltransferase involved in cell wall biosynthesis
MPSQEGFGIVYLEAMACGIPVLAGDADGSADPLQDGLLGWRVPHRDLDAVAQACIEILKNSSSLDDTLDRRVDGSWLREQTLAAFSPQALRNKLAQLINLD